MGQQLRTSDGRTVTVTAVSDGKASMDMNHHLAGKTLIFEMQLMSAAPAPVLLKEVVVPGDGKSYPKAGDRLKMHYTGTLADGGKQFDSSVGRSPFEFTIGVGQVIQGWDEGVMQVHGQLNM